MLVRIVKMTFRLDEIENFSSIFEASQSLIRNFDGCKHVELLHDLHNPAVYYTYSLWESEEKLNIYRQSALFIQTWAAAKALFAEKPEVFSMVKANSKA